MVSKIRVGFAFFQLRTCGKRVRVSSRRGMCIKRRGINICIFFICRISQLVQKLTAIFCIRCSTPNIMWLSTSQKLQHQQTRRKHLLKLTNSLTNNELNCSYNPSHLTAVLSIIAALNLVFYFVHFCFVFCFLLFCFVFFLLAAHTAANIWSKIRVLAAHTAANVWSEIGK